MADMKTIGKTALKVTGAACAATGIVVAGAVIASGVTVKTMAEGFAAAKRTVTNILKKEDETEQTESTEEVVEETDEVTSEE